MKTISLLDELANEIDQGDTTAVNELWRAVEAYGAPLIDPIEGDDEHSWVTFVWRGQAVNRIELVSLLVPSSQAELRQLATTDVWFMRINVRNDARVTYQYSLLPGDSRIVKRNLQTDPFNPLLFDYYTKDEDPTGIKLQRSVLEMPGAPRQPWCEKVASVPQGVLRQSIIHSRHLSNRRRVWVYTPPDYDPNRNEAYPLLIVFDGWTYINLIPTPTVLDNMIAAGGIPPTVAVFVDNLSMIIRLRELILHAPLNAFLVDELVPWLRANYHLSAEPERTVIGGASAGALAASYAALEYPSVFGNVLSQSGAYTHAPKGDHQDEWIARQFAERERLPIRFYMDAGDLESNLFEKGSDSPDLLATNRNLRDVLRAKNYSLHYQEFSGGHDQICWRGTLSDGLKVLLGG